MQTEFICPATGTSLAFDIPSDESALVRLWMHQLQIHCPVCDSVHATDYKQVYLRGLMAQFSCVPADVKEARLH